MKKLFVMMVMSISTTLVAFAQSATELAKQQKELNDINMQLLNTKPSKDARKQEKQLVKQGWLVPAGGKSIAKQITEVQLLGEELMADETGNPVKRYIIRSAQAVSGSFNTGVATARANAQVELAAMLQTKIAGAMESKMDNQQTTTITVHTVEKFHERAKAIIDACLTNTNTVLAIYRHTTQNNYEVQVQVTFDKKELVSRLKRRILMELEEEGDEDLNDIVDGVLMSEF